MTDQQFSTGHTTAGGSGKKEGVLAAQVISRRALADVTGSAARAIAFATYARAERRPLPPPAPLPPPPLRAVMAGSPTAASIDAAGVPAVAAGASGEPAQQVCCSPNLPISHGIISQELQRGLVRNFGS